VSKRTIGPDGRDELPDGEQEQQVPVWHSIVGEGWEPVQFGDRTERGEEVLRAGGWVQCYSHGFVQEVYSVPRRRRKVQRFAICTTDIIHGSIGDEYCKVYASAIASPGDLLEVQADGTLKRVDIEAERQVER